jgi:hypothetical protein
LCYAAAAAVPRCSVQEKFIGNLRSEVQNNCPRWVGKGASCCRLRSLVQITSLLVLVDSALTNGAESCLFGTLPAHVIQMVGLPPIDIDRHNASKRRTASHVGFHFVSTGSRNFDMPLVSQRRRATTVDGDRDRAIWQIQGGHGLQLCSSSPTCHNRAGPLENPDFAEEGCIPRTHIGVDRRRHSAMRLQDATANQDRRPFYSPVPS